MFATQKPDVWANRDESLKDTKWYLLISTPLTVCWQTISASAEAHTEALSSTLVFYLSVGVWCWNRSSEYQDSTSLRENEHTNFPSEYPKSTVSLLSGTAKNFGSKACGSFLSPSRVNVYYFIAKSCAPSKSNNTREHFQAGSSTYWRHVLNGYNPTCSRLGSVGVPVRIRLCQGFLRTFFKI